WEELTRQGRPVALAELCRDCPELLEPLRRQVEALQKANAVLDEHAGAVLASTLLPETRPASSAAPTTPSPQVGGDEILEVLGRGGMGVVYKARQVALNRLVAVKVVLSGDLSGEAQRARFRTEAEAVARLQHPNIVAVHDIGELDGWPFVVLELVEGGTLEQYLNAYPQPPRQAAELVETLARTMHVVHLAGVVHRDLKPANVLLAGERPRVSGPVGAADRRDDAAPLAQLVPK